MTDRPGRPPWRWRRGVVVLTWRHAQGLDLHYDYPRPGRVVIRIGQNEER